MNKININEKIQPKYYKYNIYYDDVHMPNILSVE